MRILVACEYSGTVRDAFAKLGHFVMSCDILPSEDRWKIRSTTYQGIADAMAAQWGSLC
jgi:hypothetical protein